MNELDVVRGIAADTPDPDAATTGAARARLLAAIRAEATTGPPAIEDLVARRKARRARRRLLPAGGVVATMLAVVLAAPLLLSDRAQRGPDTDGSDVGSTVGPAAVTRLSDIVAVAGRAPELPFRPSTYWYVGERGTMIGTNFDRAGSSRSFFYRIPFDNETWWAFDGTISGRMTNHTARFLNSTERRAWIAAGRPDLGLPNTSVMEPGTRVEEGGSDVWRPKSYAELADLPTDPDELIAKLTETVTNDASTEPKPTAADDLTPAVRVFGAVRGLLERYPVPPDLRAALYQALIRVGGIQVLGETTDLAGRRGIRVAVEIRGGKLHERSEMIIDPATGNLLGSRTVLLSRVPGWRLPSGTVMDERAFKTAVVGSPTARSARE